MKSLLLTLVIAAALPAGAFDLQGHRGARGLAPENTLKAFAKALEIGVTTLEMDAGVTRDGVVVIHHDLRLNPDTARGPDGRWLEKAGPPIHALTFEELRRFDVGRLKPGTRYAGFHPDQVAADGERVPTLAEVFDLVKRSRNETVRFDIETKLSPLLPDETASPEDFARQLIGEIRKAGMERRATIQSFDWRTLQAVQKLAPEIDTAYITAQQGWLDTIQAGNPAGSPWVAGFQHAAHGSVPKMVKAAGGRTWSAHFGDVDAAKVKEAHDLGVQVLVWTVNDPAQIARMLDLGVDGIISDRPDRVREEMKRRGMPLPP